MPMQCFYWPCILLSLPYLRVGTWRWLREVPHRVCVCACVCVCVRVCVSCSTVSVSVTPWAVTCQAPLSMEFSRQEYWNGLLSLLQEIFPSGGLNLGLVHFRQILYHLSNQASPPNFLVTQLLLTNFLSFLEFKEPPSFSFGLFWNG